LAYTVPVASEVQQGAISKIAVAVDGFSAGRDAAVLGAALARVTGAEMMLVAVHPDPLVVLPTGMNWSGLHKEADRMLREARDTLAPGARIVTETDLSVARALHRVVRREHRDLLVVGSSRHADEGRVRIGKRTRQLLCHFECALAIAPRALSAGPAISVRKIGVGYDGGPESQAALALAASTARSAGAELHVCGVVDDRIPRIGFSSLARREATMPAWEDGVLAQVDSLAATLDEKACTLGVDVTREALRGRPADALLELSERVDLLVIGSRRWGPVARVLLGSTGDALLHAAACPVLAVPRPAD
jgi:nucleotide-binding universal stress UspA family protein